MKNRFKKLENDNLYVGEMDMCFSTDEAREQFEKNDESVKETFISLIKHRMKKRSFELFAEECLNKLDGEALEYFHNANEHIKDQYINLFIDIHKSFT